MSIVDCIGQVAPLDELDEMLTPGLMGSRGVPFLVITFGLPGHSATAQVRFPITWDLKGSMVGRQSGAEKRAQKDPRHQIRCVGCSLLGKQCRN